MTELLLKLLGARAADVTHIAKASLAFRGGLSVGWFVFWLLATGALIWWLYRNRHQALLFDFMPFFYT